MRLSRKYLRQLIKEESSNLISEQTPTSANMMQVEFDDDFHQLVASLEDAVVAAREMGKKMQNAEYAQYAGGSEANDVERLLEFIWQEFGGTSLSAEGFDV